MAASISSKTFQAVILDIEGTTSPITFVTDVLFPFAREHVEAYLRKNSHTLEVRSDLEGLWKQYQSDLSADLDPPLWQSGLHDISRTLVSVVHYIHWLIDRDRKVTTLKSLQGKIWQSGYRSGELRGQVYADVAPAFERWTKQKTCICIFSSGSVLAQRLIFKTTDHGDLTRFIRANFDTTIGAKREKKSYRRIAAELGMDPAEILFVSDVVEELDAARSALMQTVLCLRPGSVVPDHSRHLTIQTFDQLF